MCYFSYLSIRLRETKVPQRPTLEQVDRIARKHGLAVGPLSARLVSALAPFTEGCELNAAFVVAHCACSWGGDRIDAMYALAHELLRARDVSRGRIGRWVEGRRSAPADVPRLCATTASASPESQPRDARRGFAVEISRDATCEPPRRSLSQLAAAIA